MDLHEQQNWTGKFEEYLEENFACCEESVKEKKMSVSRQTSELNIWKSSLGPVASPPALLDIGVDDCRSRENVPR